MSLGIRFAGPVRRQLLVKCCLGHDHENRRGMITLLPYDHTGSGTGMFMTYLPPIGAVYVLINASYSLMQTCDNTALMKVECTGHSHEPMGLCPEHMLTNDWPTSRQKCKHVAFFERFTTNNGLSISCIQHT